MRNLALALALLLSNSTTLNANDEFQKALDDALQRFSDSSQALQIYCHGCNITDESDSRRQRYLAMIMSEVEHGNLPELGEVRLIANVPIHFDASNGPTHGSAKDLQAEIATFEYNSEGIRFVSSERVSRFPEEPWTAGVQRISCFECPTKERRISEILTSPEVEMMLDEKYLIGLGSDSKPYQGVLIVMSGERPLRSPEQMVTLHYMVFPEKVILMDYDGEADSWTYVP